MGKRVCCTLSFLIVICLCLIFPSRICNGSVNASIRKEEGKHSVLIFHLINSKLWGEIDGSALQGKFDCPYNKEISHCELISSDSDGNYLDALKQKYHDRMNTLTPNQKESTTTVSLYHIHTWNLLYPKPHGPDKQSLPTDLTMIESEESTHRFQHLFSMAFPLYDGSSTTHPESTIPRTYFRGWNTSEFLFPRPYNQLIKGAVFVASTCHRGDGNTKRMAFVKELMQYMRVDSLGNVYRPDIFPRESPSVEEGKRPKKN
jgi:hypothetical protein